VRDKTWLPLGALRKRQHNRTGREEEAGSQILSPLPSFPAAPGGVARSIPRMVRAMRVYQWLKNLLFFVPVIAAHQFLNVAVMERVLLAFFAFSLCASSAYILNDLVDLDADRRHATRRKRVFASGALPKRVGMAMIPLLLVVATGLGGLISLRFVLFLLVYWVLAAAYTFALKSVVVLDIFLLAFFYTFRIFLGGEAAAIKVSFWLAAFSIFLFLSLSLVKRFVEVSSVVHQDKVPAGKRDYREKDLAQMAASGTASGYASVVVLALYINSEEVSRLYNHPVYLWLTCLAVLFWINRIWILANRNQVPYDPILFALKDRYSYAVAGFAVVAFLLAL
jgi:4-hydroxybenzoate polyprenyltransferase